LQEEIAEHVVISIEPEIHQAEKQRVQRTRPENLGAWDYSLKALSLLERMNRASHEEARELLEKSVALDPHSAYAWSMLALCHYHEGILGWTKDRTSALKASLRAAERALQNDDRDWLGHALRGMGLLWTERDHASALEGQERAVSLNPSAPLARHCLACVLEFSRRPADAIPHIDALLRLDPHYRFASLAYADVSLCQFLLDQLEAARESAVKAVRLQPANVRARQRLVAALSVLGRSEEAHTAAAALIRLQPDLNVDYIDTTYPFQMAEDRSRFIEALQRAGLLSS
jgi:adenylate cyclase